MYHGTPAERSNLRKTVMKWHDDETKQKGKDKNDDNKDDDYQSPQSSLAKGKAAGSAESRRNGRRRNEVSEKEEDGGDDDDSGEKEEDAEDADEEGNDQSAFPVILTTYEILMRDRPHLARYHWGYIVVDEGHRLKNFDCRLMREIKKLNSAGRLILSGTPLHASIIQRSSLYHNADAFPTE
jgi:ATP-dependent DNA helicase